MNIGDMAATQQPENRPNKLAHTMNDQKLLQIMRRNNGGNTKVMDRVAKLSGWSQARSQSHPEISLPIVLLIPVADMMYAA